jgi:titin
MNYNGTTLQVTITDTNTNVSATQSYQVNIPVAVGGTAAYVGFTASTGGASATQNILSWTFTPGPSAPTNLTADASQGTQINLAWTENASTQTGYNIERSTDGINFFQIAAVGNVTSYADTSIQSGIQYYYRIAATSPAGVSLYSNVATAMPPVPPATPSNLRAVKITTNEIDLTWQDNSNNEQGFHVYRKTGSDTTYTLITNLPPKTTAYNDTGLVPGTQYDYHVEAYNVAGFNDFAGLTVTTVSLPPSQLTAKGGSQSITLSWTAPQGAATYNVYRSTTSGGENNIPVITGLKTTTYTDPALASDTTYYYEVTAVDPGGESARSTEASALTAPAAPAGLTASVTQVHISLKWTASTGATSYKIYRSTSSNGEGSTPLATGVTTASFVDTSIAGGTTYYYQVTAVNSGGESGHSQEVSALTIPTAPSNVSAVAVGSQINLTWASATGATTYNVYRGTSSGGENSTPLATSVTGSSFADIKVANGVTYYYQITALDSSGESIRSAEASVTFLAAPTGLTATPKSSTQIALSWINNATSQTGFSIEQSSDGVNFSPIATASASANSFVVGNLQPSTRYTFRVRAVNSVAVSGYSNLASAATASGTGPTSIGFANGFSGSSRSFSFNGSSATIVGTKLQLTDGSPNETASIFYKKPVNVSNFTTTFSFQLLNAVADGFTFTIQSISPTAIGSRGGGLGYQGIGDSVAVKFDLYSNAGEGNDSTGLYINGAAPTSANSIDLTNTGINLHSGDVFSVSMTYNGTALNVTITDTVTNATAKQSYQVNIPAIVGGTSAYVGFTGSTGGRTATQDILTWTYTPGPAAPTNLTAASSATGHISLSWVDNATDATGFKIEVSTDGINFTQLTVVSGNVYNYVDSGLTSGQKYYFRIRATNTSGDSLYSNVASAIAQ